MPIRKYENELTRWHTQYLGSFDSAAGTPPFVTPPPPPTASPSGLTPAPPPVPGVEGLIPAAAAAAASRSSSAWSKVRKSRSSLVMCASMRSYAACARATFSSATLSASVHASRTSRSFADGTEAPLEEASPDALVRLLEGSPSPDRVASSRVSTFLLTPSTMAVDLASRSRMRCRCETSGAVTPERKEGRGEGGGRSASETVVECGGCVRDGGGAVGAGRRGSRGVPVVSFSAVDTTPNACCAALGIVVLRRPRARAVLVQNPQTVEWPKNDAISR